MDKQILNEDLNELIEIYNYLYLKGQLLDNNGIVAKKLYRIIKDLERELKNDNGKRYKTL